MNTAITIILATAAYLTFWIAICKTIKRLNPLESGERAAAVRRLRIG